MKTILRFRFWAIGALAIAQGTIDGLGGSRGTDFFLFVDAARRLVSSRWSSTFDDPSVQVGPLALLWPAVTGWINDVTGIPHPTVVAISIYLTFAFGAALTVRVVRRHSGEQGSPALELVVGIGVMVAGFCWVAIGSGQPFDAVVGIMWVLTGVAASRDKPVLAGALLGAACLVKLVAILGVPLLLLLPGLRRRAAGVLCLAGVVAAGLLPFVAFGDVATFEHVWKVTAGSVMAVVVEPGTEFPWQLRALQAAVVAGGGTIAVLSLRRSADVVWIAPLAIGILRLITDPVTYDYYWLAPAAAAVVGAASLAGRADLRQRVVLAVGAYAFGMTLLLDGPWIEPARYLLAVAVIVYGVLSAARSPAFVEEAPAPV